MYASRLTRTVRFTGRSLLGMREGTLELVPHKDPKDLSVTWRGTPLHHVLFTHGLRNIQLESGRARLRVAEHLTPILFTGLRGFDIRTGPVVPHLGRTSELWGRIAPHVLKTETKLQPVTVSGVLQTCCGTDKDRYIRFEPSDTDSLEVEVCISYPQLLYGHKHSPFFELTDQQVLNQVFCARTLGQVGLLEPLVRTATFSPAVTGALWPPEGVKMHYDVLHEVARHRALDILGALALAVPPDAYLTGTIYSYKGGHASDVRLAYLMRNHGILKPASTLHISARSALASAK